MTDRQGTIAIEKKLSRSFRGFQSHKLMDISRPDSREWLVRSLAYYFHRDVFGRAARDRQAHDPVEIEQWIIINRMAAKPWTAD